MWLPYVKKLAWAIHIQQRLRGVKYTPPFLYIFAISYHLYYCRGRIAFLSISRSTNSGHFEYWRHSLSAFVSLKICLEDIMSLNMALLLYSLYFTFFWLVWKLWSVATVCKETGLGNSYSVEIRGGEGLGEADSPSFKKNYAIISLFVFSFDVQCK